MGTLRQTWRRESAEPRWRREVGVLVHERREPLWIRDGAPVGKRDGRLRG
jgi:hypothetical protein